MTWNKMNILSSIIFGAAGFVLGAATLQIARTALEVGKSEYALKIALMLVDDDPAKRGVGAELAKKNLGPEFAALVLKAQALRDPDPHVRAKARSSLDHQAKIDREPAVTAAAASAALADEIRGKKLVSQLQDAVRYARPGNVSGTENAVRIFRSVAAQLSNDGRSQLSLLAAADVERDPDIAVRLYQAAFRSFVSLAD